MTGSGTGTGTGTGNGTGPGTGSAAPLRVLVVCTGNLCRSPLFAGLLVLATSGRDIVVVSRGAQVGTAGAVPAATLAAARRRGIDLGGHRGLALTAEDVAQADLVLTATRAHRREVVRLVPRAARSAFTVNEFARVAAALVAAEPGDGAGEGWAWSGPGPGSTPGSTSTSISGSGDGGGAAGLRARLDDAVALRGVVLRPARSADDDVADPMGRRPAAHERVARQLEAAATDVGVFLGGTALPDPVRARVPVRGRGRTRLFA